MNPHTDGVIEDVQWILRWDPTASTEHVAMRLGTTPERLRSLLKYRGHVSLWDRLEHDRREHRAAHAWRGGEWNIGRANRKAS